jgi:hypothetical protein
MIVAVALTQHFDSLLWLGAVACGAHLLLALPSVSSFTHLLVIVIETIGRLSATVGLGGVLLALAEIADSIRVPGHVLDQQRIPASEGFRESTPFSSNLGRAVT